MVEVEPTFRAHELLQHHALHLGFATHLGGSILADESVSVAAISEKSVAEVGGCVLREKLKVLVWTKK